MHKRFTAGQVVWIAPCASGVWVIEDEAVVLDDLGDGYLVLQEAERVASHGAGHFVQDTEVQRIAA
jgi:hypothetical protein